MFEMQSTGQPARRIEDIVPRSLPPYRNKLIRQRSIGFLDARYWQLQQTKDKNMAIDVVAPSSPPVIKSYTRIPPLATFHTPSAQSLADHEGDYATYIHRIGAGLAATTISKGQRVRSLPWMPKIYTLKRGLKNDLDTWAFKQARWSLPMLL